MTVLQASDLTFAFGTERILRGINLRVGCGELVALIGRSGAGKSTFLKCIMQLLAPTGGALELRRGTVDLRMSYPASTPDRGLIDSWRQTCGYVPQGNPMLPHLTVLKNVALPLVIVHSMPEDQATKRAKELLDELDIGRYAEELPWRLSGGQQQRACVARALASDPALLVLDEPTAALDSETADLLGAVLKHRVSERGGGAVIVTHNLAFARTYCDTIAVLQDGKLVLAGKSAELPLETLISEVE